MSQDRDLRAPCRMYVLVGTVVSPTAFAKRPTYTCSATDLTPVIGSSDQPLPGPAQPTLPPPAATRNLDRPGTGDSTRQRAGAVNVGAPAGHASAGAMASTFPAADRRPESLDVA